MVAHQIRFVISHRFPLKSGEPVFCARSTNRSRSCPPCRSALLTLTGVILWRRLTPATSSQPLDWGCDFFFAWRQVSPDKNVDLLRALARFTALPLDGVDFVVSCPLVRAHRLVSGLCSSSRGFASGFLQTSLHSNALASG